MDLLIQEIYHCTTRENEQFATTDPQIVFESKKLIQ